MEWIVLKEQKGYVVLISKKGDATPGMVPKGAYLTVEEGECKFILRVQDSTQNVPYAPSPLVIDMELPLMEQDRKCQNEVEAFRVMTISSRIDGLVDYIKPQSIARLSTQEEVNLAMGTEAGGPKVFPATLYSGQIQKLKDANGKLISICLPNEMFFHQTMICGRTGLGKTVAIKYLAHHFIEKEHDGLHGAVLAINVKEEDLLTMDKPSTTSSAEIAQEWQELGESVGRGIPNYAIYYPACAKPHYSSSVSASRVKPITLLLDRLDPDSLIGLLRGISDAGAQSLPGIYLKWKDKKKPQDITFQNFYTYICNSEDRYFETLNMRGDPGNVKLHPGTHESLKRIMDSARDFFENPGADFLEVGDILAEGQVSVIDIVVAGDKGRQFGAVLLQDILKRVTQHKSHDEHPQPLLIIIDEVHEFYGGEETRKALGILDNICRTGRSKKNAIIFSSQNPSDIPAGLENVVNTKIYFKSDRAKVSGISIKDEEMEALPKGYAVAQIHSLHQLKLLKFPLSLCGVISKGGK